MNTQAYVWDLPDWKRTITVARLQYGLDGVSHENSWGWFWSDGHAPGESYVAVDPWGMLWIRADTPLVRTAKTPGQLVGDPSCVWLGSGELMLWVPPVKYQHISDVPLDARQRGWYPVGRVHATPPQAALEGIK